MPQLSRRRSPAPQRGGSHISGESGSVPLSPKGEPTEGVSFTPIEDAGRQSGSLAATERSHSRFPISKAARAVQRVKRGWSVQDALVASGIPRQTWYAWLNPSQSEWPSGETRSTEAQTFAAKLSHALARAQAVCAGRNMELLPKAAKSSVGALDWRAADAHLAKADATRKRWHEHRELKVEQVGTVSHEHRLVQQLPEADVLELAGDEWAALLPAPSEAHDKDH